VRIHKFNSISDANDALAFGDVPCGARVEVRGILYRVIDTGIGVALIALSGDAEPRRTVPDDGRVYIPSRRRGRQEISPVSE